MRRFRRRRRRAAALALLPLAALTTHSALAAPEETAAPAGKARIDTDARSVEFGDRVIVRGAFPGAANAPVEIRHRAAGSRSWLVAGHTETGTSGRYSVAVKPRRSGYWRAQLAGAAPDASATQAAIDTGTGSERVAVRSRTVASIANHHTLAGRSVKIRGRVTPVGAERRIVVRAGSSKEATKAGRDGRFKLSWSPPSTGIYGVRVSAGANRLASASTDSAGKVTAYRPAAASWYGPGLYGNPLACGGTLGAGTLGVAHNTLPCGTKLRLRYGNRSVDVRVIDRGPFAGNREFDLTAATKQRLGFPDVGTVLSSR